MATKLDEITVAKEFSVAEALSSIQFYWNLAKRQNRNIIVEIWSDETQAPQRHPLQETRQEETAEEIPIGHHSE